MRTIVYYVSGHGFGHARRTAEILRSLSARATDVRVIVRTSAPAQIFRNIANVTVTVPPQPIDPGVVERDTLTIDPAASLERLQNTLSIAPELVETEAAFVRSQQPDFIAADIPFLAGEIAEAAVPCIGVGNFTWDWIYGPFVTTDAHRALIQQVRGSYAKFESILHLPLGHEVTCFSRVIEFPLVASRTRRSRSDVQRHLGLAANETRPRVLIAMRGGLDEQTLLHAARQSPDMLFIQPIPRTATTLPSNMKAVDANAGHLDFTDLLSICDAVVSKVGYGILADCIAADVALLYPRREGFREDDVSVRECTGILRMRELSRKDFFAGCWQSHLCALLAQPLACQTLATNGADAVAAALLRRL
jgi:L-arabinokinase